MESPLPSTSSAYDPEVYEEVDRWRTAILLAKHCELTGECKEVDWPRIRLVFSLCLKERLACQSECIQQFAYALNFSFIRFRFFRNFIRGFRVTVSIVKSS